MICPKCSANIEDEQLLTCPECNEKIAELAQKEKINAAYEVNKAIVKKRLHTPVFMAATVFLTIMLVLHVVAIVATVGAGALIWLFPTIFIGIAMVSGYKLYSQKTELDILKSLKKISKYDACIKVVYQVIGILAIVGGIAGAITSMLVPFINWYMDPAVPPVEALFDPNQFGFSTTGGVIAVLAGALVATACFLFKGVYAARQRTYIRMSNAASTGEYAPVKKSIFNLSYVVAGFIIFFSVALLVVPAFVTTIISLLAASIPFLARLGAFINAIIITASLSVGLAGITSGVYLILSAKWLAGTQVELIANNAVIANELGELERLDEAVKEQKFQMEKAEKAANAAAALAKEEEIKANEEARRLNELALRNEMRIFFTEVLNAEKNANADFWAAFKATQEEEQKTNAEFWAAFKAMQEENQKIKAELNEKYAVVEEQMKFLQQVVMQQMIGANISSNNNSNNNSGNSNGNQNPTIITTAPLMNPYVVPQVAPVYTAPTPAPAPVVQQPQYAPAQQYAQPQYAPQSMPAQQQYAPAPAPARQQYAPAAAPAPVAEPDPESVPAPAPASVVNPIVVPVVIKTITEEAAPAKEAPVAAPVEEKKAPVVVAPIVEEAPAEEESPVVVAPVV